MENNVVSKNGSVNSLQISEIGIIDVSNGDFTITSGFLIKNDGTDPVSLEVIPLSGDEIITTTFAVGWNPEIIKTVKENATEGLNIKWGY